MNFSNRLFPAVVFVLAIVVPTPDRAQTKTQKTESKTTASPELETQKKNLQAYIDLLRDDVRQQKAEMMGRLWC